MLNSCLEAAVEDDRIAKNPARAARADVPSLQNREMLFLTHEEVQALAAAVPEEWRILILTLAYSGIRWGEAAALRRSRCLLLENKIHIKESLSEVGGVLHLGLPKSNKPRWVSIPGFLTDLIADLCTGNQTATPIQWHSQAPRDCLYVTPTSTPDMEARNT